MRFRFNLISVLAISLIVGVTNSIQVSASDLSKVSKVKSGIGSSNAVGGGVFQRNLSAEPTTLNPITGTDLYSFYVKELVIEGLLARNPETYKWDKSLATEYSVSKDGKEFTFVLREGAVWSDGKPVTAEDVKFSFDTIFDDRFKAAFKRPFYENIKSPEIVNSRTVKFTATDKYFGNFDVIAGLYILPKHIYGDPTEAMKMNKTMHGSGPYVLKEYNQGQSIVLEKNPRWWGYATNEFKGRFNFQTIRFRMDKEENMVLERLKKGELDFERLTTEAYAQKTNDAPWGKTVKKIKVESLEPKGYRYVGWNLTKDLFSDVKTRRALAMLLNREEMNKKFSFGMSLLASGPWYQQSEYANPLVKPVMFEPKKAVSLLKEAGWLDSNRDGVLERNGKAFEFSLFYANKDMQKYWVFYQEDLKKVGIKMNLQLLDWNALLKSLDERKFDAVALGWGGGAVHVDPKGIWHSDSRIPGGNNRIGYSNPEVDRLIDLGRAELDEKKRIKIFREVYSKIAADYPVAFLFNEKFEIYASTQGIAKPKDSFRYALGTDYWWSTQ